MRWFGGGEVPGDRDRVVGDVVDVDLVMVPPASGLVPPMRVSSCRFGVIGMNNPALVLVAVASVK